ncbi:MAG: cytochrome c [Alicyclobacillus sp.]|nr:cytochrome c [Alicyclobacillus sp.]
MLGVSHKLWLCGWAACLGVSMVGGCGRAQADPLAAGRQAGFATAVQLYQQAGCITCHGDRLQGGIGPNLVHVGARLSAAQIAQVIAAGAPPMPGYGPDQQGILTETQIQQLAAWLSTLK